MQRMTLQKQAEVRALLRGGLSRKETAAAAGLSYNQVNRVVGGFYDRPSAPKEPKAETRTEIADRVLSDWNPKGDTPTRDEIDEACRLLRQAQPPIDEGEAEPIWHVPTVRVWPFEEGAAA